MHLPLSIHRRNRSLQEPKLARTRRDYGAESARNQPRRAALLTRAWGSLAAVGGATRKARTSSIWIRKGDASCPARIILEDGAGWWRFSPGSRRLGSLHFGWPEQAFPR